MIFLYLQHGSSTTQKEGLDLLHKLATASELNEGTDLQYTICSTLAI